MVLKNYGSTVTGDRDKKFRAWRREQCEEIAFEASALVA